MASKLPGESPVETNISLGALTFEELLAKLGVKDRANAEKRVAAMEAKEGELWKRLCVVLLKLSGHSVKVNGKQSVQFFAADGKYRMQTFALQDGTPGELVIYCRDVLEDAVARKLLQPVKQPRDQEPRHQYQLTEGDAVLVVEQMTNDGPEHPAFFKDLMSWNRKCMRIALSADASESQVKAVEALCAVSAEKPAAKA